MADYPNNVVATFVYATDPEGNIVELQNWEPANQYGDTILKEKKDEPNEAN